MNRRLFTSLLLVVGMLQLAAQQTSILTLVDSQRLSAPLMPLDGSTFQQGALFDKERKLFIRYDSDTRAESFDLKEKTKYANFRIFVQKDQSFYGLDYPYHLIRLDAFTGKQRKLTLDLELDGVEYDIVTLSISGGVYLPKLDALAFAIMPVGNDTACWQTSLAMYRHRPLIGLFRLEGRKAKLSGVIGQRDSAYWTGGGTMLYGVYTSMCLSPDGQGIYLSQSALPQIGRYDLAGRQDLHFGKAAEHAPYDSALVMRPDQYTRRRQAVYSRWATLYMGMHLDTTRQRLYRRYRLGEPLPIHPDSLAQPDPPVIPGTCPTDPYLNLLSSQMPNRYGLQVYDLSQATPALLHDVLFPAGIWRLVQVDDGQMTLYGRKPDGSAWLYQGKIISEASHDPR
jgi:hypothetical protein